MPWFKTESVSHSGTEAERGPGTSALVLAGAQSRCVSFIFVAQNFIGVFWQGGMASS